jgi:ABC-2 type transport system ATP-binding protein
MSLAIECRNLRKVYPGGVEALAGVDLAVSAGECFGLLGPNGAGKTTTVEILEGLLKPTSGEVRVLGRAWKEHEAEIRRRIGTVLQGTRLPDRLTVREVVELFASFYPHPMPVEAALQSMALENRANVRAGTLSEGQRQRLNVACGLVGNPELLFLDEPTTGLDPHSRHQLWAAMTDFRSRSRTIIFTTHYMEEAERLCDRVAIIDRGRVLAVGKPKDLIAGMGAEHVVELSTACGEGLNGWTPASFHVMPGVVSARRATNSWSLLVTDIQLTVPALMANAKEHGTRINLSTRNATLEDLFVSITGQRLQHG